MSEAALVRVEDVVKGRPGLTARQIAVTLSGTSGYGEQVRPVCDVLVASARIEKRGAGGPADPYRYYPARIRKHA